MLEAHIYIRISFACTRISSPFPIHAARIIIYGLEAAVILSPFGPFTPVVKLLAISLPPTVRSAACIWNSLSRPRTVQDGEGGDYVFRSEPTFSRTDSSANLNRRTWKDEKLEGGEGWREIVWRGEKSNYFWIRKGNLWASRRDSRHVALISCLQLLCFFFLPFASPRSFVATVETGNLAGNQQSWLPPALCGVVNSNLRQFVSFKRLNQIDCRH